MLKWKAFRIVIKMYNLSPEAAGYVREIIWYHGACVVTIWPLSFTLPNTLRASGDVKYPMMLAIVSMWVFRIGFSWLFRRICFTVRYLRGKWERIRF